MKESVLLWSAAIVATMAGCNSGPNRVEVPDFKPEQIGARAVEQYDNDGDGMLSAKELELVQSLESAMSRLDANGDGKLAAEEIAARIKSYVEYKAGLAPVSCTLTQGGRPVAQAKVNYEPEQFMGSSLVPAFGTTDSDGAAVISVAEQYLPSPRHAGVRPGFYRVQVTLADGTEMTELDAGAECAGDLLNQHAFRLP